MREFARKQNQTQKDNSINHPRTGKATSKPDTDTNMILRLQRTIGNQAVLRMLKSQEKDAERNAPQEDSARDVASEGITGPAGSLPHLDAIQQSFGSHDVSGVEAHTDERATAANQTLDAVGYTIGNHVAFAGTPDLHTAAHEAAHVVQQRAGVHLKDGVGQVGDAYERQADAVAEQVVKKQSAEGLLESVGGKYEASAVQRKENGAIQLQSAPSKLADPELPTRTLPSDQYSGIGSTTKQRAEQTSQGIEKRIQEIEKQSRRPVYDFTPDHAFYEILAHDFAYRNDLDSQYLYNAHPSTQAASFDIMSIEPQILASNKPLYYKVHSLEVSDQLNNIHGLAAYYLIPVNRPDAPGIMVFRGTEPALVDILSDAEKEGPGASSFDLLKLQIGIALLKLKGVSSKTVVTGHSLGAALAQLTTATFPGVSECVTFNSPGISNKAMQNFATASQGLSVKPESTHYVTRGDIVSTAGQKRLPGKTIMLDSDKTRELERLYANDVLIEVAAHAISLLKNTIDSLAAGILPSDYLIINALTELKMTGGLKVLKKVGEIFGDLHTQTLIPGSKAIGEKNVPGTTWRSEPPTEQISIPEVEQGRSKLGAALFIALTNLLTKTIPNIMTEIVNPSGSPLAPLAKEVKLILDVLDEAIRQAGGLKGFIGKLLYVDPITGQIPYSLPEVDITAKKPK